MKKIILVPAFLLLTFFSNAQMLKSLGAKSGITLSNQTWNYKTINNKIIKDNKKGICITANAELFDKKYASLIIDAAFVQKGAKEQFDIKSQAASSNANSALILESTFNYLSISPMAKLRFEQSSFIPYIIAGPRLDFLINYKSDNDFSSLDPDIHKIAVGLSYGGGIEFRKKHIGLLAEAQQHRDLTSLINKSETNNSSELTVNNQSILIQLGFKYYFRPY